MADQIDPAFFQELARLGAEMGRLAGAAGGTASAVTSAGSQIRGSLGNVSTGMMRLRTEIDRGKMGFDRAGQSLRYLQDQFDDLDDAVRKSQAGLDIYAEQQRMAGQLLKQGVGEVATDLTRIGLGGALEYYKNQLLTGVRSLQENAGGMQTAFNLQNQALKDQIQTLDKLSKATGDAATALATIPNPYSRFAAGVAGGISVLADLFSGAKKLQLEGLTILQTELIKTADSFKIITNSGAIFVDGMEGMRQASADAKLDLKSFAELVSKNTEVLSNLGGTVTSGTKKFTEVNKGMDKHRIQLLNLGFSYEQQAEATIDYMSMLQSAGQLEGKKAEDLAKGTADYLVNLRAISAFTGEDVKRAQERAAAAGRQLAVNAKLMDMGPGAVDRFNSAIKNMEPMMQQAMMEAVAFDGTVVDKNINQLFALSPSREELFRRAYADFAAGLAPEEITRNYQRNLKELGMSMAQESKGVASSVGAANLATAALTELTRMLETNLATGLKGQLALAEGARDTSTDVKELADNMKGLNAAVSAATIAFANSAAKLTLGLTEIINQYATTGVSTTVAGVGGSLEQQVVENERRIADALAAIKIFLRPSGAGPRTPQEEQQEQVNRTRRIPGGEAAADAMQGGMALGGIAKGPESGFNMLLHGTEAVVPLPDNRSIPVNIKYMGDSFATAMQAEIRNQLAARDRESTAAENATTLATTISGAIETAFNGPTELSRIMQTVRDQLSNDNREQLNALQTQLDKLDQLVTAMQNNVYVSERIANELS
jgi:hypothetical protein